LGEWLPAALVVIGAVIVGRPEIAVGVIFATSVAALTLVLGIVTIAARHTEPTIPTRRMWGFVLSTAMITLLIGFSGGFRWIHIPVLLLQGAALVLLWNDLPSGPAAEAMQVSGRSGGWRFALILLALLAGVVAAWAGIVAARDLSHHLELPGAGLVSALMLSPALVLPMIGSGSLLASNGRYDEVVQAKVGFVLLNLLALLPLATLLWLTRPAWSTSVNDLYVASLSGRDEAAPTTLPTTAPESVEIDPVPTALAFPLAVWRVDTVMLVTLGLLLLPVALGRWSIGMGEGYGLIIAYTIYMVMTAILAR
jgi:Ca2+/Na+ antiporter